MEPLSLKSVVLFIACGCLAFIIVFIFAKRQITRFTLKSRRGPHAEIGEDAPKALKEEIYARLKRVVEIKYEPPLISDALEKTTKLLFTDGKNHYWFRMKAMDTVKSLDEAFKSSHGIERKPGENMAGFLRTQGPICNVPSELVDNFILLYNHARFGLADFTEKHCNEFTTLLENMIQHVRSSQTISSTNDATTKSGGLVQVTYRARHGRTQTGQQKMTACTSSSVSNVSSCSSTSNLAGYCKTTGITGNVV
ncbi:hypothetical protein LSAT2_028238 [Lamellibrachia satsuma]|nr:hypothetical protein LSAT2_028238 [Lamellibrachia satsuma]